MPVQNATRRPAVYLLAGFALGVLMTGGAWHAHGRAGAPGRVVEVGPVEAFASGGQFPPVLFARDQFYFVRTDAGAWRALYAYPPSAQLHDRPGCAVVWFDAVPPTEWREVFRDPCYGDTFGRDGTRLFGPSPRDLDHFRVEVKDGRILVDTRRLLCGRPGPCQRLR